MWGDVFRPVGDRKFDQKKASPVANRLSPPRRGLRWTFVKARISPPPFVMAASRSTTDPQLNRGLAPQRLRFRPAKAIITLPAYNEEEALPELLERIGEAFADSGMPYEIIVVDDGSTDATASIVEAMSFQMPLHLVRNGRNLGLGKTLRRGLREAIERGGERDIIITMDADNTHPPGLIARMVRLIHEGCDVVIASRFQIGSRVVGVPKERHVLSFGARLLFTLLYPTRGVRDYTSGYRAYRMSIIRRGFERYEDDLIAETGFSCMADLLLKLRRQGAFFGEAPLRLRYDQKGGESKMMVMKTIGLTLRLLVRHRLVR